jgi:hypothetical protein
MFTAAFGRKQTGARLAAQFDMFERCSWSRLAVGSGLDLCLRRDLEGVINLDAEVPDRFPSAK